MIAYKVCRARNNGFYSLLMGGRDEAVYTIGKMTIPPIEGSPLFLFETFEAAHLFLSRKTLFHDYVILECIADEFSIPMNLLPPSNNIPAREYWAIVLGADRLPANGKFIDYVPWYTVLCENVMPVEVVRWYGPGGPG
jgi:hypothetical protein